MNEPSIAVIGGGLAGCECALALARQGQNVTLFEQKPLYRSPAHVNDGLAELVCSNSLRSDELTSGVGLLKQEMRELGSAFIEPVISKATKITQAGTFGQSIYDYDPDGRATKQYIEIAQKLALRIMDEG